MAELENLTGSYTPGKVAIDDLEQPGVVLKRLVPDAREIILHPANRGKFRLAVEQDAPMTAAAARLATEIGDAARAGEIVAHEAKCSGDRKVTAEVNKKLAALSGALSPEVKLRAEVAELKARLAQQAEPQPTDEPPAAA